MKKAALLGPIIITLLILVSSAALAQDPTLTPVVVTATPIPQIVVVTATPSVPPAPKTFWSEYGDNIIVAVIALVFGVILAKFWEQISTQLGKLVADWLGKLGSGWGFRRRYLAHLIEAYRALNIRGLRNLAKVTVELEHIYVSLSTRTPDDIWTQTTHPPQSAGEVMKQHQRLAILGGPGTGKSTLLAFLTLTYARGQAQARLGLKEKRLPIYVPLRRLKDVLDGDSGKLPDYLDRLYAELGITPKPGFFEHALRRGRCLVMLDGLDEVADETERRQMSEWVDRLVAVYPENRYIVTSRPPGYDSTPLSNGFAVLHVQDFGAQDIRQFARNWCLAVEIAARGEDNAEVRRRAQQASTDLVAAIEANEAIRRLAVNPLLLSIIALVHRYRATLPKRRVDLYDECVQVLLGHWDEAKGLVSTLSPREKQAILQPLAFEMHREKRREIARRELVQRIGELLPRVGGKAEDAGEFVDEIKERSGLLVEVGLGQYGWSHLTFQEYLCAQELADEPALQPVLMANLGDEWWQEATLLYAGMADATPVVDALLDRDDADCAHLLLAGRCVAEAVRVEQHAREQVIRLLQAQFGRCEGPLFLRMGEVLAQIAGEDSVGFFLAIARDDPQRREAALWALGEMARQQNETLRERVITQLVDGVNKEGSSIEAIAVLFNVWGSEHIIEQLRGKLDAAGFERAETGLAKALDKMLILIPAGKFLMGDNKEPKHVDEFCIDKYPVTNVQYKQFVDATKHNIPSHWKSGTYPEGKSLHPVVNVSWHDASAYAKWASKTLPTEAQWEKAARSADGREYPWGDGWKEGLCNTHESGIGGTTPVGQFSPDGDSPYGCADMAGNVWEWTDSWYDKEQSRRVVRGGSWGHDLGHARCAARRGSSPDYSFSRNGFRCVSPISISGS
ncbi:MAG: SUMF1/EgtB/PvdO family nonheme iron enzyme [Anaerolineae bacterium]|nr:SUMF1/EgtB/PvdO family nonheme iron enzyme [Anaerolineae bacterium]